MVYLLLVVFLLVAARILDINICKTKFVYEGMNTPFFGFNAQKFRRKIFLFSFFFIAILIMGFRALSVGTDTAEYKSIYFYVTQKNWQQVFKTYGIFTQFEIGYAVLMKFCSMICDNYFYFQFVSSIIYCTGMAVFIYSDTDDMIMRLFVFLGIGIYLRAFNIARQAMAIMLLMNCWKALKKKKTNLSVVLYVLAITCHSTSIVFAVVYLVELFKGKKKIVYALPFVLFIFVICAKPLISVIIELFPKYAGYMDGTAPSRPGLIFIVWLIISLLSLGVIYHKTGFNDSEKAIAVYSLIYVAANVLGVSIAFFERFSYYFTPFVMLLFPMCKRMVQEFDGNDLYSVGVELCFFLFYALEVFRREQYFTFF